MNAKFLLLCWMVLGTAMAFAAPPRVPVTADPNDPEKTRTIISREEREKLGLSPRTWTGVVHPDVYATLDRLNKTVESLKDRLRKGRDVEAFDSLWRIHFEGTVYVQVRLKHETKGEPDSKENLAAIKDVQRRVLGSLKASEFHAPYLFEGSAAFVGYATKEALDKLAKNLDVAGVCLDDKPLPDGPQTIFKDSLPPAKPGEAANEPGVAEGKVEADVYRALALSDRIDVGVSLRTDSLPPSTDVPSEMRARHELRNEAERQLQDRVLSTLSADDFWLWGRRGGVSGYITKEGLQKLWKHPDVLGIGIDQLIRLPKLPKRLR